MKNVAVIADQHAGHRAGLTPPQYQATDAKWNDIEAELWERYTGKIETLPVPDILIVDGDCTDGRGQKSGGTELLTTSLSTQCDMAVEGIMQWKAHKVVIARGTDFHVAWSGEDWEDRIAEKVSEQTKLLYPGEETQVIIKDHPFITVDGVTFDIKHHIGSTSIPHGGGTAMLKDKLWNEQWWMNEEGQPLADVILRAHAHFCEGSFGYRGSRRWDAIRCPALQAAGTKYGGRRCSRTVHWGFLFGEVHDDRYWVEPYIIRVKANQVKAVEM